MMIKTNNNKKHKQVCRGQIGNEISHSAKTGEHGRQGEGGNTLNAKYRGRRERRRQAGTVAVVRVEIGLNGRKNTKAGRKDQQRNEENTFCCRDQAVEVTHM